LANLDYTGDLITNWISTYGLMIQFLQGNELSESNILELQTTASLCAKDYGESVHWARALLADSDSELYDNIDDCEVESDTRKQLNQDNEGSYLIKMSPNPATKFLTIEVDYQGEIAIDIFDISGKIISKIQANRNVTIDISDLLPGLYFIQVRSDEKVLDASKFIVE